MRAASFLTAALVATSSTLSLAKTSEMQQQHHQLQQQLVDLSVRSQVQQSGIYSPPQQQHQQPKTSMPETAPTQSSTAPPSNRRPLQRRQVVTPDSGAGEAMKTARKIVGATAVGVLVFVVI